MDTWMVAGASVSCAFDMQALRSGEIGFEPYIDNAWRLTVRDGKIVWAHQSIPDRSNGFLEQMWIPFGTWISTYHPDDVLTMYFDKTRWAPRYTDDSNRLWEQRSAEYVAAAKQNPASLRLPRRRPSSTRFVRRRKPEPRRKPQAIPQQNQPAITEARQRVMRETMPKLRAVQLPKAVFWPYEGRAFPLLEHFYGFPHNVQPPESLAHQIQQIPGLNKCISPV